MSLQEIYDNEEAFIMNTVNKIVSDQKLKKNRNFIYESIKDKFLYNLKNTKDLENHTLKIDKILLLKEQQFVEELNIFLKQIIDMSKIGWVTVKQGRFFIFNKRNPKLSDIRIDETLDTQLINLFIENIKYGSYLDFVFINSNINLNSAKSNLTEYIQALKTFFSPFNVVSDDPKLVFKPSKNNYFFYEQLNFIHSQKIGLLPSEQAIIKEIKEHFKFYANNEKSESQLELDFHKPEYHSILRYHNIEEIISNYRTYFSESVGSRFSVEKIRTEDDIAESKLFKSLSYHNLNTHDEADIYVSTFIDKLHKYFLKSLEKKNVIGIKRAFNMLKEYRVHTYVFSESQKKQFEQILPDVFNKNFDYINQNKEGELKFLAKYFNELTTSTFSEKIEDVNLTLWKLNFNYYKNQFKDFAKTLLAIQKISENKILFNKSDDDVFIIKNNDLKYSKEDLLSFIIELSSAKDLSNIEISWREFELACKFEERNELNQKKVTKVSAKKI